MAEALNADHCLIQQPPIPARPEHSQGMGILRAPDMNHIRTECIQPLSKQALQLRCLPMGPLAGENKVGKTLAQAAGSRGLPQAENLHSDVLLPAKIGKHMIHP